MGTPGNGVEVQGAKEREREKLAGARPTPSGHSKGHSSSGWQQLLLSHVSNGGCVTLCRAPTGNQGSLSGQPQDLFPPAPGLRRGSGTSCPGLPAPPAQA